MLTHLHFRSDDNNRYYSGHLSLQNMMKTNRYSRNILTMSTNPPEESYKVLITRALSESERGEMSRREIARWIIDHYKYYKEMKVDIVLNAISTTLSLNTRQFVNVGCRRWKLTEEI